MLREAASEEAPRLGRENLFRGKPFNQKFETLGFLGVTPKTVKQTFDVAFSVPVTSIQFGLAELAFVALGDGGRK
jgi:hypothetical protein